MRCIGVFRASRKSASVPPPASRNRHLAPSPAWHAPGTGSLSGVRHGGLQDRNIVAHGIRVRLRRHAGRLPGWAHCSLIPESLLLTGFGLMMFATAAALLRPERKPSSAQILRASRPRRLPLLEVLLEGSRGRRRHGFGGSGGRLPQVSRSHAARLEPGSLATRRVPPSRSWSPCSQPQRPTPCGSASEREHDELERARERALEQARAAVFRHLKHVTLPA